MIAVPWVGSAVAAKLLGIDIIAGYWWFRALSLPTEMPKHKPCNGIWPIRVHRHVDPQRRHPFGTSGRRL